ncbi:MAG: serine/threonine protein kinase [Gemmataceae bacterium]|nr:serine/threonine protein kinase [Gemmataceae bacterium]MDW8264759.1 serine/threonine-protein kinase [Gemmataceae bacterium]
MSFTTPADFIKALRLHDLLSLEGLMQAERELLPAAADARQLAKQLIQRGWLTVFQVNALFHGQGGELVQGPYRILDRLGEGGVSQVFKAWHVHKKTIVALKVLRPELLTNAEALGRFRREMYALAQSSHPNIVGAIDLDLVGDRTFFAMEYVEGTDLGKLVQLNGPLRADRGCEYLRQAALGLQHAHEKGLVHRDIKPANLLVTSDGRQVKILDLGLARLRQTADPARYENDLTVDGSLIGTPDFMSPEQARNPSQADIRSDIYSLGCTFFYAFTGRVPFPSKALIQKVYHHRETPPPTASEVRPGLPRELDAILKRMMAKRPEDRYPQPLAVAQAVAPLAAATAAAQLPGWLVD